MGVGGQRHAPADLPPGKIRYPSYGRLGGPQVRPGRMWKISSPLGFDPRTVQPEASRYTDWAISAYIYIYIYQYVAYYSPKIRRWSNREEWDGGVCSTYVWEERRVQGFGEETWGKDPDINERIILRWIFRKWDVGAWTGSMWLRIGTGGGRLWMR